MKKSFVILGFLLPLMGLLSVFCLFASDVQAKPQMIDVGGSISSDTIWTLANSPYIITDTVTVEAGATLTVEAGATIMFMVDMGQRMVVEGHLEVAGTAVNPVTITTMDNLPGDRWSGIHVTSGSANFVYTTLRYAYTPLFIAGSGGGDVNLENSTIEENDVYPIYVGSDALHRLKMDNVTFQNNTFERIFVDTYEGQDAIVADVNLETQPGLDSYEFGIGDFYYTPSAEFIVPDGITLTVGPGVQMRFGEGAETLVVNGRLQAIGTPTSPITFTSAADSAPGEWEGVILQGGSSQLENVVVRNGRENLLIGSLDPTATVQIGDSTISDSSETPLGIQTGNLHQASLSNITFANNVDGNNIVLYGPPVLGGDAVLNDQPGLDAYVILDGNLSHWFVVSPTATLSINSGVTLKFNDSWGSFGLRVEGELHTVGTPAEPVILTSQVDSAPGQWTGIWLDGGSAQIEHTIVRYSEEAVLIGELDASDMVQIANSVLQSSSASPLGITANTLHQLSLNNVTFSDNQNGEYIVVYENGALAGDVTLRAQPGLAGYVIFNNPTSQLIVPTGVSLTLEQGITLKFVGSSHELLVQGHLQTTGNSLQPVILTSWADSAPNQWAGIMIENGTAQLDYAEVRYGEYNVAVNNTAVSTPVVLQNSQLHSAALDGLLVSDGAVTAVCSHFTNNNGSGVYILSSGQPEVQISSSALVGNGEAGLFNQNANVVDARQNWWGEASGPAGIGSGTGDAIIGNVIFAPWLREETCTTQPYQLYLPSVVNP